MYEYTTIIPFYTQKISWKEFFEDCLSGVYDDFGGYGIACNETHCDLSSYIYPSQVREVTNPPSHVIWYWSHNMVF